MVRSALAISAATLLLPTALASLYSKSSPVIQVDGSSYQDLIANSNHTSIVEFYAPWCGHCKNLQPAYEKAAKSLAGLAKVAAVNCDEESNKAFCGQMGVQGFPTLKIVKPGKKAGRPIVDDYQGERSTKAIVDYVLDKIPNHVKKLKDADFSDWLEQDNKPKAILFSSKNKVSSLLKATAIDYLGTIDVAQIHEAQTQAVETFDIQKFPTLVLIPGDDSEPIKFEGDMKKEVIIKFLSQAAPPNPDPAPKTKKAKASSTNKSKASKASSSFSKASESDRSSKAQSAKASQTAETLEDENLPYESPSPEVDAEKPIKLPPVAAPIATLDDDITLQRDCLNSKARTCILVFTPEASDAASTQAISSLSEIHAKYERSKHALFPFYQLPTTNPLAAGLREQLSLEKQALEIVAVNGKRRWYRHYAKTSYGPVDLEEWVDAIRMGDGAKQALPDGVVIDAQDVPAEAAPKVADKPTAEDLHESIKNQMPEGVKFDFEEISEDDYERIITESKAKATHDEL